MENKENRTQEIDLTHGIYEVHYKGNLMGRQELGFIGLSTLYINFHGEKDYEIKKI